MNQEILKKTMIHRLKQIEVLKAIVLIANVED